MGSRGSFIFNLNTKEAWATAYQFQNVIVNNYSDYPELIGFGFEPSALQFSSCGTNVCATFNPNPYQFVDCPSNDYFGVPSTGVTLSSFQVYQVGGI
jgi:hypothetical protein